MPFAARLDADLVDPQRSRLAAPAKWGHDAAMDSVPSDPRGPSDGRLRSARGVVVAIVVIVICYSAFSLHSPLPTMFANQDKVEHVSAFAALSALILWRTSPASALPALLIAAGFGVEAIQGVLGYRESSFADALASALGVLIGWSVSAAGWQAVKAMLPHQTAHPA